MRNVAKAITMDANFYTKGPETPEFLQDRRYFYNVLRDSSEKSTITDSEINQMFIESILEISNENVTEEMVENFLTNTALVLDEKQKLDLLKGQESYTTRQEIMEASPTNGIVRGLKKDPSKIGDIFEKIGQDVNISELEEKINENSINNNSDPISLLVDF